jgi:ribosomal protein S18 acetylase RimI-like enzyme
VESPDALPLEHFRFLLDSDEREVLVAEQDGRIAGYASLEVRETPDVPIVRPRRLVFVHEIGVSSAERGQGVGRMLMEAAERWAREQGATAIELHVYEFNASAIAFYEHLGFTSLRRAMSRPLDGA